MDKVRYVVAVSRLMIGGRVYSKGDEVTDEDSLWVRKGLLHGAIQVKSAEDGLEFRADEGSAEGLQETF